MAHAHHPVAPDLDEPLAPERTRRTLNAVVTVCLVATAIGLAVLWPRGDEGPDLAAELGFVELVDATVQSARVSPCSFSSPQDPFECDLVSARLTGGPDDGEVVDLEFPLDSGSVTLRAGDAVVLNYVPDAPPEARYQFADFQRRTPLLVLGLIFAGVVVALGRWRGLLALVGLGVSLVTLTTFVLPAILEGRSPIAVALVGCSVIAVAALYLAHGVTQRTTVAVLGTLASLALTGALAVLFVGASELTGLASEEVSFLRVFTGVLDFEGLLLAGIIIGALGVLDDVTVTQVSAVWELRRADPAMGARDLYTSALRIGRDHIASAVNTLVLAYAGASLPLLLLFSQVGRPLGDVVNGETVAVEIVRTLVGSIGLVASVPITTALAVAVVAGPARAPRRAARGSDAMAAGPTRDS